MLVSVVVLNWNGSVLIEECLDSVFNQSYSHIEVILVDNGSTDDSVAKIKKYDCRLIELKTNTGFAKGINTGIKASKGDFVLPLNNDVFLEKDYITNLVGASEVQPQTGSLCGKLLRADNKNIIDSLGHVLHKNRLPRNIGAGERDENHFSKQREVFGVCGAAPLYNRNMLEDILLDEQYFDEDFFSFLEDVDLDWRARLRGWKAFYVPEAVAWHHRGGTAVRRSKIVEVHNYKNRYLMIVKNDYALSFIKNIHQIIFTDIVKSSALLFRCPSALLGIVGAVKLLPKMIRKRRQIAKNRSVPRREIEQWFMPFNYKSWFHEHLTTNVYDLKE